MVEKVTVAIEEKKQRAEIYKILSVLYYQPTADISELLDYLKESMQVLCPKLVPWVKKMQVEFRENLTDLTPLKVDHARLFVGPFDLLAVPYGSVHLEGERQLMGDSTMEALEYYRKAGLKLSKELKEAPDHIAIELEFIYYLIFREAETGDIAYARIYEDFLNSHLGLWAEKFSKDVQDGAETSFYGNLGFITGTLIKDELKEIA